ncbi:class I SAM-dependent methyltransferase [Amycolatopsis sp. FU40]|uniref:class I SAM-dependent methyltransferase n=1 Tax=Amycolatopsis sp. FU40 TaxID=2914159 RepID=UPI00351CFA6D
MRIFLSRQRWRFGRIPGDPPRRGKLLAGVAAKIGLVDGDLTELPFPADSVDLVTGCLAAHNLHPDSRRAECVSEASRVLRPGGRLLLVDFSGTARYARLAVRGRDDRCRSKRSARRHVPAVPGGRRDQACPIAAVREVATLGGRIDS